MRLAIFCIDGLCSAVLPFLRLAALDNMEFRDMASTIPAAPITSWTSAWTGEDPGVHGKFAGARGKKPKLKTVWEMVEKQGLEVTLHEEGDWDGTDGDIHIYRLDSLPGKLVSGDLGGAQEALNGIAEYIDKMEVPYMILSAVGICQHSVAMNIDIFLQAKEIMTLDNHREIAFSESRVYPANFKGAKPRPSWGIYLNRITRDGGFLEMQESLDIEANLLQQVNIIDGAEAVLAHQAYDITGQFFDDLPDIIFKGNGRLHFRNSGETDPMIVSPCLGYGIGPVGMVAASDKAFIENIHMVTDIKSAILDIVKMIGNG
jgi:hypothetical protein